MVLAGRLRVSEERTAHFSMLPARNGFDAFGCLKMRGKRPFATEVPIYKKAGTAEAAIASRAVRDEAGPFS